MDKKKRKQHSEHSGEQSCELHYGTLHEGPAHDCEQKGKNELGEQEALTRKKRKRDKASEPTQQATEIAVDSREKRLPVCNATGVRNEGQHHVFKGATKQKSRKDMKITENYTVFSVRHDVAMLPQTQEKKKKKKKKRKNDQGLHDPFSVDHAKDAMHISDEDDMLFNFSTHPIANIVANRGPQVNSDRSERNTETFLGTDETLKNKKSKKKRVEGDHNSLSSDHHKETTCHAVEDAMVFNFVTQPVLANNVDYKSQVAVNKRANGSFGKEKNEVFMEQKGLKGKEKKEITAIDEGTPEKNRSERNSTELASRPTLSMAVAGSIVDNAQSLELATMLAGQIARAAAIFRVDEIVVFDDYDGTRSSNVQATMQEDNCEEVGGLFMVRILKYLEVPQYLRRALIPMHRSLSSVGKLPPLDAPHHLRKHEWRPFREGVVLDKRPLSGSGSCVDVGLEKEVVVSQKLESRMRVTVAMGDNKADGNVLQVVDRETARQAGFYWGYSVRYASCISAVFDECPFEGKYDFCIGTSEHGEKLGPTDLMLPKCKHLLVAFGGLSGLEESVEIDKRLQNRNVTSLFNRYINTCPNQGSRTIRTEEAILISLQFLQAAVQQALSAP